MALAIRKKERLSLLPAKMVADADSSRVLGLHIIGANASELIAVAVTGMEFGGDAEDIARAVHTHLGLGRDHARDGPPVDKRTIHV